MKHLANTVYLLTLMTCSTAFAETYWELSFNKIQGEWAKLHAYEHGERGSGTYSKTFYVATKKSISKVNAAINSNTKAIKSIRDKAVSSQTEIDKKIEKTKNDILLSISALNEKMTNESNLIRLKEQIKEEIKRELGL